MGTTTHLTISLMSSGMRLYNSSRNRLTLHFSCIQPPLPHIAQLHQLHSMTIHSQGRWLLVLHPFTTMVLISIGSFPKVKSTLTCTSFLNYHLVSLLLFEGTPYMTSDIIGLVDELYEMRLETLLSVQDLLQDLIETLEVCFMTLCQIDNMFQIYAWYPALFSGSCHSYLLFLQTLLHHQMEHLLDNTFIFYNSDHGSYDTKSVCTCLHHFFFLSRLSFGAVQPTGQPLNI